MVIFFIWYTQQFDYLDYKSQAQGILCTTILMQNSKYVKMPIYWPAVKFDYILAKKNQLKQIYCSKVMNNSYLKKRMKIAFGIFLKP